MSEEKSLELRVSVDVGHRRHSVAMGLSSGEVLEEFEIDHRPEGFQDFFARIEKQRKTKDCRVAVAMEGYNGHARPLDSLVRERGYRLYNLNNLKFARFKEIFPGAAKSDRIDARKGLELFQLGDHLPLAKEVLQEVSGTASENEVLKRLTRRRRRLVNERVRVVNNLQADLQAVCPGLLEITREASNQWFLNFLLSADTLPQLARLKRSTLLKIPSVGVKSAAIIEAWQKRCHFSKVDSWVWCRVYFRVGRRDRHHRTVCLRRKYFVVSRHVHVGQQFRKVSGDQSTQARQHSGQSSDDDRRGSASKVCSRVAEVL